VQADKPLAVFPRKGSGEFEINGSDFLASDFEDFGSGLVFCCVVLHVVIFALSARCTSLFSHFVRFIFIRLRNSLKTREQTDGHQRDKSRESS